MAALRAEPIRQKPSPLPPVPDHDFLTAEQWGILFAIADAVVPSLTALDGNRLLQHPLRREIFEAACSRLETQVGLEGGRDLAQQYLSESATAQRAFKDGFSRLVNSNVPQDVRNGLIFIARALNTRAGALLLTGHATPLDCLPIQTREDILLGWQSSRLPFLRTLHRS
ncbi:hypothetical protein KC319_g12943, partial [Hortaea werneckii]